MCRSYEFTDDEIDEAFHFIDLDKNTFLGAAEIRHILVCMGELVTDEEIDAMIHLVDADGDGYAQHYTKIMGHARHDVLAYGTMLHVSEGAMSACTNSLEQL